MGHPSVIVAILAVSLEPFLDPYAVWVTLCFDLVNHVLKVVSQSFIHINDDEASKSLRIPPWVSISMTMEDSVHIGLMVPD